MDAIHADLIRTFLFHNYATHRNRCAEQKDRK